MATATPTQSSGKPTRFRLGAAPALVAVLAAATSLAGCGVFRPPLTIGPTTNSVIAFGMNSRFDARVEPVAVIAAAQRTVLERGYTVTARWTSVDKARLVAEPSGGPGFAGLGGIGPVVSVDVERAVFRTKLRVTVLPWDGVVAREITRDIVDRAGLNRRP